MEQVISGGVSMRLLSIVMTIAVSTAVLPIWAQTPPATDSAPPSSTTAMVTPFQLVSLAYQGYFRQNGIPSGNALTDAYRRGLVVSENLVQIAVQQNRVPADTLGDLSYLQSVDHFLKQLANNNDRG